MKAKLEEDRYQWIKHLKEQGITIVDTGEESVVGGNDFMCFAERLNPQQVINVPVEAEWKGAEAPIVKK